MGVLRAIEKIERVRVPVERDTHFLRRGTEPVAGENYAAFVFVRGERHAMEQVISRRKGAQVFFRALIRSAALAVIHDLVNKRTVGKRPQINS